MMMLLKELKYTTREGGNWDSLMLTPGELELVEEYLDAILTPVTPPYITLPVHLKFLPSISVFSLNMYGKTWDVISGWRL